LHLERLESLCVATSSILVESATCQSVLSAALSQRAQHSSSVWRSPHIISLPNAISEWHEQEVFGGLHGEYFLLTPNQELFLWKQAILSVSEDDVDAISQLARLAREAWFLMHSWSLNIRSEKGLLSTDSILFSRWCKAYKRLCDDLSATDYARVLSGSNYARLKETSFLNSGFLSPSPVVVRLLGQSVLDTNSHAAFNPEIYVPHAFESKEFELCEALAWADVIVSQTKEARVVIVLNTAVRKNQIVRRCCESVLGPTLLDAQPRYYLAEGDLIATYPPIRIALLALDLNLVTRWDVLSEFIRHPLLKGAGDEYQARVLLDEKLRNDNRFEIDLRMVIDKLRRSAECPELLKILEHVVLTITETAYKRSIAEWLVLVERFLSIIGVGPANVRTVLEKRLFDSWLSCCNELVQLDTLAKPLRRLELCKLLKHKIEEKCLSSQPPKDGIFLVSASEACLIEPTHVWVLDADSETFSSRNKFCALLPLDLQRQAQMPFTDPLTTVKAMYKLQGAIGSFAIEHHVSFTNLEGDSRLPPSTLFPTLEKATIERRQFFRHSLWESNSIAFESYEDTYGPALPTSEPAKAGVTFFADQSACAFRAFAKHRLRSTKLPEMQFGTTPAEKGMIVHELLAALWTTLKRFSVLRAMDAHERLETIEEIVMEKYKPLFYETRVEREIFLIEKKRLTNVLKKWVDFELSRSDIEFEVLGVERQERFDVFGIPMNVRIDRVDRLQDGRLIVIDYKTGKCSANGWKVPRMESPQLPIYALFLSMGAADDIAFAYVHGDQPDWLSGLDKLSDWDTACISWRDEIKNLAFEIRNGFAMVNPKTTHKTCVYCDQSLFCRIPERLRSELTEELDASEQ
jgi:ATP-dependent helicase/nuclease subunit B